MTCIALKRRVVLQVAASRALSALTRVMAPICRRGFSNSGDFESQIRGFWRDKLGPLHDVMKHQDAMKSTISALVIPTFTVFCPVISPRQWILFVHILPIHHCEVLDAFASREMSLARSLMIEIVLPKQSRCIERILS